MTGPLSDVFGGRRVLVTGHTGFKGGWLSFWLAELGAQVTGLALDPDTEPSFFHAVKLAGRVQHRVGDIRRKREILEAVRESHPEFIFHLAAQSLVRRSYRQPVQTFDTNVLGTANVLDAARQTGFNGPIIVATSDKCYENREQRHPFTESDPLGGKDPYSASKAAAELVVGAFRESYFASGKVALASVRAGNVIGGGDWAEDRIVSDLARAMAAGGTLEVRNPAAVRPWQHVIDALSGYLWLAARMHRDPAARWCGAWNFGPDGTDALTVRELVEMALARWGKGGWQPTDESGAPRESGYLTVDASKARRDLGWKPVWTARQTVDRTVDWYREHAASAETAAEITRTQIEEHTRMAAERELPWAHGTPAAG